MSAVEIRDGLYWVGVLDPDLRVFDVVMETQYGTSYNSYILKTPKYTVLFETAKEKWFDKFMANLKEVCDPAEIDYIVIDHTEPDHAGSIARLLDYAPKARILASPIALGFLNDICNRPLPVQAVADNEVIELDTVKLRFLSVPFLHWPDSIYTYIEGMETLVTCDSFGCHYADERICNDLIEGDFLKAYKYYFDMIMGPFKSHVQYALERIKEYRIDMICPGHGPVLRERLDFYVDLYDRWSRTEAPVVRERPKVVIPFVTAYGYTEELAREVAAGIHEATDADVTLHDMVVENHGKVLAKIKSADGVLFGTPTINGDALPPIMNLAMALNGIVDGGKVAGAFGSYGWSGEGPDMVMDRLKRSRMKTVEPALKVLFKPAGEKLEKARIYGRRFGKKLQEEYVKIGESSDGKSYWKCTVCGEIFESALPPQSCPVCGAGAEAFTEYVPEVVTFRSDKALRVGIVGGGAAAVAAAQAIRIRNETAEIFIFSREKIIPYYRPVMTKAIAEKVDDEQFYMHHENFYKDNRITLHLNQEIKALDTEKRALVLADGSRETFDKIIIATGARNFVPPIQGTQLKGVVALREKDHFNELERLLDGGPKRIVVMGGGLLGLETAWELKMLGHQVDVFEASPIILPRQLDTEGALLLKQTIEESGVNVHLGVFVEAITGGEQVRGVELRGGRVMPCDVVVVSTGTRTNLDLAKNSGIETRSAIIVNERMQTSNTDIYAAGDCAQFDGKVEGLWETALEQGKVAGAHAAGDDVVYARRQNGVTFNAFGVRLFSVGDLGADDTAEYRTVSSTDQLNRTYRRFYFRDGRLVGGVLMNDQAQTNPLLAAVSRQLDIDAARELLGM